MYNLLFLLSGFFASPGRAYNEGQSAFITGEGTWKYELVPDLMKLPQDDMLNGHGLTTFVVFIHVTQDLLVTMMETFISLTNPRMSWRLLARL